MANKKVKELIADLRRQGYVVVDKGVSHPKVCRRKVDKDGKEKLVLITTLPRTPSDVRSLANSIAFLRRQGYVYKGR